MKTRFEHHETVCAIAVHMKGQYCKLNYQGAMQKLSEYCANNNIADCGGEAEYVNVYYDDPRYVKPEDCRVDVSIAHPICKSLTPTDEVDVIEITGGKFVVFTLEGAYQEIADKAYCEIYGDILPNAPYKYKADDPMWERYVSNPDNTSPDDYITEIWIPIE